MKKVLAISGSPRKGGNTVYLLDAGLKVLEKHGFETELVSLAGKEIAPCKACLGCRNSAGESNRDLPKCAINDDFDEIFKKMLEADAIILGSPVYFGSATPQIKALIDRAGYSGGDLFRRKVGAAVVVARRAGQNFTLAQLMYFFLIKEMIVSGSTYWNIAFGREEGDVVNDPEGIRTVENLANNIGWLLEKL